MSIRTKIIITAFVSSFLVGGCDQIGGSPSVAIIDLVAIAEATGADESIQAQADAARNDLAQQLQQIAAELDAQINAEREAMGPTTTAEQEQQLQAMSMQARQQLANAQSQAQAQAEQIELRLVNEFREGIIPLARQIATGMGASMVIADDSYIVWNEDSLDITEAVIAAWRARAAEETAADETAQLEEELEQVEEELAETIEKVDELEEVIEDQADVQAEGSTAEE